MIQTTYKNHINVLGHENKSKNFKATRLRHATKPKILEIKTICI
jgi:hypothetical protein